MMRWPDNPALVSTQFLAELDAAEPSTYLAQQKLDGRRRIISTSWHADSWRAKDRAGSHPPPKSLVDEFYSMRWPHGVELDCEYMGLRHKDGTPEIHVFDLLGYEGTWRGVSFASRYLVLSEMWRHLNKVPHVHLVECVPNPGMSDFFAQQLTQPMSEGIVVRHKDHKHIGALNGCASSKTGFYKIKHRDVKELP